MANIMFITQSLSFGGAEKILSFVADSLSERQHKVCIVNLKGIKEVVNYERNLSKDIIVKSVSSIGRKNQIIEISKIVKKLNIEIIIGFTEIPNVMARIVGLLNGIPSIMSERGDPLQTGVGKGLKNKIVLLMINGSKGGVFQTEGARAFYGKGLQKRGIVIANPIFVNVDIPYVKWNEREKTVVSVARLDNFQKRYDIMLDAFGLFSKKHPEYILKLYGKGNDEKLIRNWVDDRDLSSKVQFMGLSKQPMLDIYRDGMFLITSDFEGISNSLLEAMAAGLPCVSTDHTPGGARLLIQDHENGLLCPVGDVECLAAAMEEFALDSVLSEKCSNNARNVKERFAPDKIIDMWEEYILKVLGL